MKRLTISPAQQGFTLIELLLVAIILGILAAVVVPQFSGTSDEAKANALKSNLATLRGAIDLYAQQHNGVMPGVAAAGGTFGAAGTDVAFKSQLSMYTNAAGEVSASKVATHPFGPYLKSFPKEPISDSDAVVMSDSTALVPPVTANAGWLFASSVGRIIANLADARVDTKGVKYNTY